MDFSDDLITRMLENERADVFLCDADLNIVRIGSGLSRHCPELKTGQPLSAAFPDQNAELTDALSDLRAGTPFFSTNFELFRGPAALFLLPVLADGSLSAVVGCLDTNSIGADPGLRMAPVIPNLNNHYRAPLGSLLNILARLAPRFQESEDYAALECLNEAARCCYQVLRCSTMIEDYYLLTSGRIGYHPQKLLLSDLLTEACRNLPFSLSAAGYVFSYEDQTDAPVIVLGEERLLSRALYHLITNACRYSPRGSSVTVSLSAGEDSAYIQVADEGIGIPPAELEHVFQPFVTGNDVPRPEEEMGLGLGLPIVREIAALHGGSVLVSSKPNSGTKVTLALPLCSGIEPELCVRSPQRRYVNGLFSDFYILFSDICQIQLF